VARRSALRFKTIAGTIRLTLTLSETAKQRVNAMKCMRAMIEDAAKLGWGGKLLLLYAEGAETRPADTCRPP
jgi:hypothetical protein